MQRVAILVAVVVISGTMLVSSAPAASGWAGSRYAMSDCSQIDNHGRPGLYCQKWFSSTVQTTQTTLFVDGTCTGSGLRAIERSGMLQTRFLGFDYYSGPVPLAKFNTGGDNVDFTDTWLSFTDTDRGCI